MEGTPRLKSAFPATPQTFRRRHHAPASPTKRSSGPLPQISPLSESSAAAPGTGPIVPEEMIDAPSQRLYAVTVWAALWAWKVYDYVTLQEMEEQSLWLFMKWVALDGVFLFGLPNLRIPWLEWTAPTMLMLFIGHAMADFLMMFRVALPFGAVAAAIGRGVWGAYEMAVNEHRVNPERVRFNESLILGRQVIHILPEGSAALNPERLPFCLDSTHPVAHLPITINATNPIAMELVRIDLDTPTNETIHIGKRELKTMHKEAARLLTYSDKPNEPKTIYWPVKKPGVYMLQKVIDESNLEVRRKQMAHTPVVPCPRAALLPSDSDKCRGDLSHIDLEVVGTPPLRLKYRKIVNEAAQDATFESIQPDEFFSPLSKSAQKALTVPNYVDTAWVRPQSIRVPLSEALAAGGTWVYSIEEVSDAFNNTVSYSERDHERAERHKTKSSNLHQVIIVHERPTVQLRGCTAGQPLKVPKDSTALLPVSFGSSGRGEIENTAYHMEYRFSPPQDVSANGEHAGDGQIKQFTVKNARQQPAINEPGLYTLTRVSTDFCVGDVLEPASCLLQNPPEPSLSLTTEEIHDKCAGSPIGLRVDLDLIGTPPFEIEYTMQKAGDRQHNPKRTHLNGLRGQIELTPESAGDYVYRFVSISDAVYKKPRSVDQKLVQKVKPAASARFVGTPNKQVACIEDRVSVNIALQGEGPFQLEYEIIHGGKRTKHIQSEIVNNKITVTTDVLRDGGDYTLALVSVTDRMGCKEFLKEEEAKIAVRHQKPKVGFGLVDGRRSIQTLEGKTVPLPLRLAGEGPWSIRYRDPRGREHTTGIQNANDRLSVAEAGSYQLLDVRDSICPGQVDEVADTFELGWIAHPAVRFAPDQGVEPDERTLVKADVCEGDEDAVELVLQGSPPYQVQYVQNVKPPHGAVAPKTRELRAPLHAATIRMDTAQAGAYEYKFSQLGDANYEHSLKHFNSLTIQQKVHARPTVAFSNPGKTYSYCAIEADGEEVIPITLHGAPPFDVEVEIKHHGTAKPETYSLHGIKGHSHNIRIPHSRITPGKSAVQLRRVSDRHGCSRLLDSAAPRVQISVHDLPTITALEGAQDFCVGDRINFALSGTAPFTVTYEFEGHTNKAVVSGTTFRRLAEKPGRLTVVGLQDNASNCRAAVNITKHIHGLPSVRVSHGKDTYTDIHEGGEAEILFEFGGSPPFEFTYTRSSNTEKGGRKAGVVLDMRSEMSEEHALRIVASEAGTYEVVAIKDRFCSYAKPGVKLNTKKRLLTG